MAQLKTLMVKQMAVQCMARDKMDMAQKQRGCICLHDATAQRGGTWGRTHKLLSALITISKSFKARLLIEIGIVPSNCICKRHVKPMWNIQFSFHT